MQVQTTDTLNTKQQPAINDRPDLEIIAQVRDAFRGSAFDGQEIWRLVGPNITNHYFDGTLHSRSLLMNIGVLVYYLFFRDFIYLIRRLSHRHKPLNGGMRPVFIEAITNNFRFAKFWLPVAEHFRTKNGIIITEDEHVLRQNRDQFHVYIPSRFHLGTWLRSRIFILRNLRHWMRGIKKLQQSGLIQKKQRYFIMGLVVYQINMLNKAGWLYKKLQPRAFVTTWDWYDIGAAFCVAAKNRGVKTFTFIHGAMGRQSFPELLPLNADYVFSWGQLNTWHLRAHEVPAHAILETGTPKLHKFAPPAPAEIRSMKEAWKLPVDKPIILLPFTYVITDYWIRDVNYLIENLPDFHFVLRPHPSNSVSAIVTQIRPAANWVIFNNGDMLLEDAILMSDYVVVDSSTAGFDALFMGKDVIALDSAPQSKMQDVMLDACEERAAIFCTQAEDAVATLLRFHTDAAFQKEMAENRAHFVSIYVKAYGTEAVQQVCLAIDSKTEA